MGRSKLCFLALEVFFQDWYNESMTKYKPKEYFERPETFATSLLLLILDQYGTEPFDWDPQTLQLELEGDFGVKIPPKNIDKLHALITALTTDQFYRDPMIFGHICDALNNQPVGFEYIPCPQPEEMAWGITEVSLIEGDTRGSFSSDVRRYIAVVLETFGMYHPPDVLKIADYASDTLSNAESNLGDDPDMYAGFYTKNQADGKETVDYIKTRLVHLLREVDELPLAHRDKTTWSKFHAAAMKKFNSLQST
jgi:hypothetical protein